MLLEIRELEFFHEDAEAKVLVYTRWDNQGSRVAMAANFSDQTLTQYPIPNFPATGTWRNWISDSKLDVTEQQMVIDLPAYEAQVLVWQSPELVVEDRVIPK